MLGRAARRGSPAAILRPDAFDDLEWLFEPKFDGFRGILYLDGPTASFTSKQRRELARFSRLAEEVRDILKVRNAIRDSEVVAIDDEGQQNFKSLMSHAGHLHYAAFDLLWLNGKDLRGLPLVKRRRQLERLLPATSPILSHTMSVPAEGKALFAAVRSWTWRASLPSGRPTRPRVRVRVENFSRGCHAGSTSHASPCSAPLGSSSTTGLS